MELFLQPVGPAHYMLVGSILFCLGLLCMMTKRNIIAILLGVELVLNGANLNFVAFGNPTLKGTTLGLGIDGQIIAIFVIVLAAAEAAVALAIALNYYTVHDSVDVDRGKELKG